MNTQLEQVRVALVTGGARRIGAAIATRLHESGFNIVIHYRKSHKEATALNNELNSIRENSSVILEADLSDFKTLPQFIKSSCDAWGRLDALINNASSFYETPVGTVTEKEWYELLDSNLKAPFFLSQAAVPELRKHQGCIVNITDIHAERPLESYSVYCISKSGLVMMTKALAKELGPEIRVNAVAPGAILWPEESNVLADAVKQRIIDKTALKTRGSPEYIASAVNYLVTDADYVTGQVYAVDGGRNLST